jgi:hypothetical protein
MWLSWLGMWLNKSYSISLCLFHFFGLIFFLCLWFKQSPSPPFSTFLIFVLHAFSFEISFLQIIVYRSVRIYSGQSASGCLFPKGCRKGCCMLWPYLAYGRPDWCSVLIACFGVAPILSRSGRGPVRKFCKFVTAGYISIAALPGLTSSVISLKNT